jgi:LmbE family N-acetylglucosaminyl deacetylase
MSLGSYERMLILAPHTDDGELGCGGTIAKAIESGTDVTYVAFSSADKSLRKGFPLGTLRKELMSATKILGIPAKNVICHDFEVRDFSTHRQKILECIHKLNKDLSPDIVFSPSLNDLHQDHKTVAEEARRIFKRTTMLGFELPWNNISFDTYAFSVLGKKHLKKKIEALKSYKSQTHKEYFKDNFIESLAITRGVQVNVQYAEAFEVVRWLI